MSLLWGIACEEPASTDTTDTKCPEGLPTAEKFLDANVYNTGKEFRTTTIEDLLVSARQQTLEDCRKENADKSPEKIQEICDSLRLLRDQSVKDLTAVLEKFEAIGKLKPPPECPKGIWEDFGLLNYLYTSNPAWNLTSITVENQKTGELLASNSPNQITTTQDGEFSLLQLRQFGKLPKGENVIITVKGYNQKTRQREEANLRIIVE